MTSNTKTQTIDKIDAEFTLADWEIIKKGIISLEDMRKLITIRKVDLLIKNKMEELSALISVTYEKGYADVIIKLKGSWYRPRKFLDNLMDKHDQRFLLKAEIEGLLNSRFGPSFWYHNREPEKKSGRRVSIKRERDHSLRWSHEATYYKEIKNINERNPVN